MALLGAAQVARPGCNRRVELAQVLDADGDIGQKLDICSADLLKQAEVRISRNPRCFQVDADN